MLVGFIEERDVIETLDLLVGTRSKDLEELKNKMAEKFFGNLEELKTLKIMELKEDKIMEVVCDNAIIATIRVIQKDGTETEYDVRIMYIKDNLGNYYITEISDIEEIETVKNDNYVFMVTVSNILRGEQFGYYNVYSNFNKAYKTYLEKVKVAEKEIKNWESEEDLSIEENRENNGKDTDSLSYSIYVTGRYMETHFDVVLEKIKVE